MPQKLIIQPPPTAPAIKLSSKPDMLSPIEHFLGVATGLSEQEPADVSDFIAASAGVLAPTKLIGSLLKRLKVKPTAGPAPKKLLITDPKMDRRQFFRSVTGQPARDANEMRDIIHDRTFVDLDGSPFQRSLHDSENKVWDRLEARYGDADVPPYINAMDRAYDRTGDFEAEPTLRDTIGGWADHLQENLLNEYKQAMTAETWKEFQKGLNEAGSGTASLVNALLKRTGIRK